jgi:hypothetical protein
MAELVLAGLELLAGAVCAADTVASSARTKSENRIRVIRFLLFIISP